jgi:hypothetical protein
MQTQRLPTSRRYNNEKYLQETSSPQAAIHTWLCGVAVISRHVSALFFFDHRHVVKIISNAKTTVLLILYDGQLLHHHHQIQIHNHKQHQLQIQHQTAMIIINHPY